ncbi:MAG: hypothetical protein HOA17_03145, partial [Candidatus Melainabacteria bacterium]|nr:hypothetical protein [Candidatus Melainabacteria bacterium]
VSIGDNSRAVGFNALSIASDSLAIGLQSVAIGHDAKTNADYSIALGAQTKAKRSNSIAIGIQAIANGSNAVALGGYSEATGNNSTALGFLSKAYGGTSVALGGATANGHGSFAVGQESDSYGNRSMALGYEVYTNAVGAVAIGSGTKEGSITYRMSNSNSNSLAVGFNSNIPTLFVGTSAGRDTTGNVGVGTVKPDAKLDVAGVIKSDAIIADNGNFVSIDASYADIDDIETNNLNTVSLSTASLKVGIQHRNHSANTLMSGLNNLITPNNDNSVAIGERNNTAARAAATIGYANVVASVDSNDENGNTQAIAPIALGYKNVAKGTGSIAMGAYNHANANNSIAIGKHTSVNAEDSIVLGHDITNNHGNSLLIGFEESKALFATTGLKITKEIKAQEQRLEDYEFYVDYYTTLMESNPNYRWLKRYIDNWEKYTIPAIKEELADLVRKGDDEPRVGINTEEPKRSLHISGVMRLEPIDKAPLDPSPGDIFMHESGALCVYMKIEPYVTNSWRKTTISGQWEKIVGEGDCL